MGPAHRFYYTDDVLRRALGAQSLRLRAIGHNVANANTPGFKRTYVEFEAALQKELELARDGRGRLPLYKTHPGHLPAGGGKGTARPRLARDTGTTMRNDGNNVDPDREMAELARTQLVYQALTRVVSDRYRRLRAVVQQGGR